MKNTAQRKEIFRFFSIDTKVNFFDLKMSSHYIVIRWKIKSFVQIFGIRTFLSSNYSAKFSSSHFTYQFFFVFNLLWRRRTTFMLFSAWVKTNVCGAHREMVRVDKDEIWTEHALIVAKWEENNGSRERHAQCSGNWWIGQKTHSGRWIK